MSDARSVLAPDFKPTPWWWERTPPSREGVDALPAAVDVAIVGSGYTGLHAAIALARAGRSVLVLDAEALGWGCSTRNGGQISTSVKPSLAELTRRHGAETAAAILEEGRQSLAYTGAFIAQEGIDCDFAVVGRFHAAHTAARFRAMAADAAAGRTASPARVVARAAQRAEIGTDAYHGGLLFERHASLDPARYHAGLLALARAAGVVFAAECRVTAIAGAAPALRLETARGPVRARDVVLATNGYSDALSPWHRRRVIPIGSSMIATEELPQAVIDAVLPTNRIVSDSRRVVYYYRASPDRRRILFGGRVSHGETDPVTGARLLHREMVRLFPQLAGSRVSRSWMGFVAYTFDTLAHTGSRDGVHYAMGYCGSGVGMAGYLGMRLAGSILGAPASALAGPSFHTRPFYHGRPWFLAPAVLAYRLLDRIS